MHLTEFISKIKDHPEFGPGCVYHYYERPKSARFSDNRGLEEHISSMLKKVGIRHLYTHQAEAIDAIEKGRNVIISTPTASGKSLIYNISVLKRLTRNPDSKAIYIFPLKALEQDQLKVLQAIMASWEGGRLRAGIYDGDTSPYQRKKIRSNIPEILMTNPDMLHMGILPYHHQWKGLFENLELVILDEVHTYRGIFGSHMSQIIRRLKRICRNHGSSPNFIMLSATMDNPDEFGRLLIQEEVEVINSSGAPCSGRHFLFINPDMSPNFSSARFFIHCIKAGFRTIAFTQSRKVTELIHVWINQMVPELKDRVSSYRSGFMPHERRKIEADLLRGKLLGVVSTSALEMGIDIGTLDICILVGYPGSIINTYQRGGRVGRAGRDSLIVLIAKPDALDQYFMKHPEDFFRRSYEAVVLDPDNTEVKMAHLGCAAAEIPLTLEDATFFGHDLKELAQRAENMRLLVSPVDQRGNIWFSFKKRPHLDVNIRSTGETYSILNRNNGRPIGTIDGIRAFTECHPGAVYLHRAEHYLVDELDIEKKNIFVRKEDVKYFTRARIEKETEILEIKRSKPVLRFILKEGRVRVTETVTGYEKRALPGQELMGVYPLELPSLTFETIGMWMEIESLIKAEIERAGLNFMGGIHAIEHAMIGIFPLFAMCDRNDLGGISYYHNEQVGKSAIFIYDAFPGGVGLASRGFDIALELTEKTLDLIKSCDCEEGCPSCIHSPKCGSGNKPLDKKAAIRILEFLTGKRPLKAPAQVKESELDTPALTVDTQESESVRIIYLDIETKQTADEVGGWQNAHLMGVSVAVIYDSLDERYYEFFEHELDALFKRLKNASLIVGFNIKRFDYRVLGAYTQLDFNELITFDILEDIYRRLGFRLSLDHLMKETLNRAKIADGIQAVRWYKMGEMDKLVNYCREDVKGTRDLFLFGLQKGHLIYRRRDHDMRVRLPVQWNIDEIIDQQRRKRE